MTTITDAQPGLRGDEAALFDALHRRLLRATRRAVSGPDALIEDACAFAWMQFLRHQPDRAHLFAWLMTTARREAWQQSRRQRRTISLNDGSASAADLVEGPRVADELAARAALRQMAALRPAQRYALARHVAGLSYEEIGREGGLTVRQVERHLVTARRALRGRGHKPGG